MVTPAEFTGKDNPWYEEEKITKFATFGRYET